MSDHLFSTPFGFDSTAADVIAGVDLTGKRAIVTGASSGIGVETARALADAGAEVTLAVRDTTAGNRVAADIGGRVGIGGDVVAGGADDLPQPGWRGTGADVHGQVDQTVGQLTVAVKVQVRLIGPVGLVRRH